MTLKNEGKTFRFYCRIAAGLISLALIYATAAPLLRSDQWWIRIFDFPRVQITVLIGLTLASYAVLCFYGRLRRWEYVLMVVVGFALAWQLISIAPYTALYPKEMADSRAEDKSNRVSILIYNVLTENKEVTALLELIRDNNPDIVLLSEPNQWWLEQLDSLKKDYPHTLFQPQENNYGALLYSRLELEDSEIRYLIEPEVPSLRTKVRLRSGTAVTLYGVHPRPPGIRRPQLEDGEREDTEMRDAELITVAKEVRELGNVPVIVTGDFNDVAWSHTTHLFQRIGGLLDPRVGRGFINTFDTGRPLLRYPLDHLFASQHFFLGELRRLPDIGSDHFPLFVVLDYNPDASVENEEPQPDQDDKQEAEAIIEKEESNDDAENP